MEQVAAVAGTISERLNAVVERAVVALLVVLVLMVWLGVLVRYVIPLPITFTEEASRYLMIWMALLAVSCGIARREHIGVTLLFDKLPRRAARTLLLVLDVIAFAFFGLLFVYGVGFAVGGATQFTMIYQIPKTIPFASVPVAAALACIQLALVACRDQVRARVEPGVDRAAGE